MNVTFITFSINKFKISILKNKYISNIYMIYIYIFTFIYMSLNLEYVLLSEKGREDRRKKTEGNSCFA